MSSKEAQAQAQTPTQDQVLDRVLYEQSPSSKTLFFTTATSSNLKQTDGRTTAYTGIYQCTLEEDNNFDDFNDDINKETCKVATKLATGANYDGAKHTELILRNLQFDLSSLRSSSSSSSNSNSNYEDSNKKTNYLYANTHTESYRHDDETPDWEIVRAELPHDAQDTQSDAINAEDGTLKFESVFRTLPVFDWNECNFNCCVREDYTKQRAGFQMDDFDTNDAFRHAYVRTIPRSYVVDEHTGDVFISWEGFYKNCEDVFAAGKNLQWTIGISRLRIEDPACTFLDVVDLDDVSAERRDYNFVMCTEPVSIVYQSSRGREVVLPYGGLAVIPSSQKTPNSKRSFLLTVLNSPGIDQGELTIRVWAFPEGGNSLRDGLKRQDLTAGSVTTIDSIFLDQSVWDGGTLRLHYNKKTGRPDHLCRTIYEHGIECMGISVTENDDDDDDNNNNGMVVVESTTKPEIFLTKEQTAKFCRLGDADRTKRANWGVVSTIVTGLDVQWNDDDDKNTVPERIFFGCFGGEGGNGNFGSVGRNGKNLLKVMEGAFTEAVLFLPHELEGTILPRATNKDDDETTAASANSPVYSSSSSSSRIYNMISSQSFCFAMIGGLLMCLAIYKRRRRQQRSTLVANYNYANELLQKETGFRTPYVELQSIVDNSDGFDDSLRSPLTTDDDVPVVVSV